MFAAIGTAFAITQFGAIMPDLDESNSHVYRWFRPFVAVCAALYVFILLFSSRRMMIAVVQRYVQKLAPGYLTGIVTVSLVILTYHIMYRVTTRLLGKLIHRNRFHQLPMGVINTLVLYAEFVLFLVPINAPRQLMTAAIFATAFLTGLVSHRGADGLLLRRKTYICKHLDDSF
jgi:hypothetical protein